MSDMSSSKERNLLPCPFCGNDKAARLVQASAIHEPCGSPHLFDGVAVVCDALNYGCGASAGFKADEAAAIAIWNARSSRETTGELYEIAREIATMDCFYSGATHEPDCKCIVGRAERAINPGSALKSK